MGKQNYTNFLLCIVSVIICSLLLLYVAIDLNSTDRQLQIEGFQLGRNIVRDYEKMINNDLIQLINSTADIHMEYMDKYQQSQQSGETDILKTGVEKNKRQWENLLCSIYDAIKNTEDLRLNFCNESKLEDREAILNNIYYENRLTLANESNISLREVIYNEFINRTKLVNNIDEVKSIIDEIDRLNNVVINKHILGCGKKRVISDLSASYEYSWIKDPVAITFEAV